jgi:hypothetical protein
VDIQAAEYLSDSLASLKAYYLAGQLFFKRPQLPYSIVSPTDAVVGEIPIACM